MISGPAHRDCRVRWVSSAYSTSPAFHHPSIPPPPPLPSLPLPSPPLPSLPLPPSPPPASRCTLWFSPLSISVCVSWWDPQPLLQLRRQRLSPLEVPGPRRGRRTEQVSRALRLEGPWCSVVLFSAPLSSESEEPEEPMLEGASGQWLATRGQCGSACSCVMRLAWGQRGSLGGGTSPSLLCLDRVRRRHLAWSSPRAPALPQQSLQLSPSWVPTPIVLRPGLG